jgi:uncharacterized protein
MREYKILFVGTMGAGKTTAITAISEIPPTSTEALNSDRATFDKSHTTVAMDYGEITLDGGDKLRLYGTPGQARFDFMWNILGAGALGVILLIDHGRGDPLADLRDYATRFAPMIQGSCGVVAVGRLPDHQAPEAIAACQQELAALGLAIPVFSVDVRQRTDVLLLLEALLGQIEAAVLTAEAAAATPELETR